MDCILVISDEPALAETLKSELGIIAVEQTRFKEAAVLLREKAYRVIVIDEPREASLPDTGKTPVIRLTRPIVLSDLLYTIGERLQGKILASKEEVPLSDGFRFCPFERMIRSEEGKAPIALTEKETELLQCLLEAHHQPVAREALLKRVWGYSDDITTHTLETHIYRLRGKLRQASESLDIMSSEEGGYWLKL